VVHLSVGEVYGCVAAVMGIIMIKKLRMKRRIKQLRFQTQEKHLQPLRPNLRPLGRHRLKPPILHPLKKLRPLILHPPLRTTHKQSTTFISKRLGGKLTQAAWRVLLLR
jgi:hypothetical protein